MKKFTLAILLLLFTSQLLQAQNTDSLKILSPKELHDYYTKKKRTNTTVGIIMLAAGTTMTFAGWAINLHENLDFGDPVYDKSKGLILVYVGVATTLFSIPILIAAGKNAKQARLALKNETVMIGNKILFKSSYPAVSFVIRL